MPVYRLDDVDLHADMHGHGPTVVYVHGGFATLGRWLQAPTIVGGWVAEISTRVRVLSYDRRGCERSSMPADGYDPVTQAHDLIGLLDAMDLDRVHLFASSAGGPVAVVAAAGHPARFRSLTIQGSALRILRPGDGVRDRVREAFATLEAEGAEAAFDRRPPGTDIWFESPWGRRQAAADGSLAAYLDDERLRSAHARVLPRDVRVARYAAEVRNIHAYDGFDLLPHAATVATPTLVIHGDNDRIFTPDEGRQLAGTIAGARFCLLEGAGHGPVFTHDRARSLLLDYITDHNAGGFAPPARPCE